MRTMIVYFLLLQLIDPSMRVSTDFPGWLASDETKAKLQGKNVLMYCTGGTRQYAFQKQLHTITI
jgi:predicted sulfurtransferase